MQTRAVLFHIKITKYISKMPPRGRNRTGDTYIIQTEDLHLASNYLTENYWKMVRELKKPLECPICMTDLINPPPTEMGRGYALLVCGHSQCLRCYFLQLHQAQQEGENFVCAVCRS